MIKCFVLVIEHTICGNLWLKTWSTVIDNQLYHHTKPYNQLLHTFCKSNLSTKKSQAPTAFITSASPQVAHLAHLWPPNQQLPGYRSRGSQQMHRWKRCANAEIRRICRTLGVDAVDGRWVEQDLAVLQVKIDEPFMVSKRSRNTQGTLRIKDMRSDVSVKVTTKSVEWRDQGCIW